MKQSWFARLLMLGCGLLLAGVIEIRVGTGACGGPGAVWACIPTPTPTPIPLGVAVNKEDLSWTSSGQAQWFGQNTVSHDGLHAAQSGDIADNQSTNLETSLTGPGQLSFWWRASSEAEYDYLRCYINDMEQPGAISGESGWQQCSFSIPPGTVRLKWAFQKNVSVSVGADCGWVDQVAFSPLASEEMGLSVTTLSAASLKVQWSAVAGATAYQVYRAEYPGGAAVLAGTTTALELVDATGLRGGTRYDYWVVASVAGAQTVSSDAASGVTLPGAPVVRVETLSNHGLRLVWPAVAGASGGYRIYRTDAQLTTPTLLGMSFASTYDDLSCPAEATCSWYRVKAVGEAGESEYSSAASGWTAPNSPSGLVVQADDATSPTHSMLLTFTDNSARESGFIVERSSNGADNWTSVTLGGSPGVGGVVTYHDGTGINEGRHYWYRVKARLNVTP